MYREVSDLSFGSVSEADELSNSLRLQSVPSRAFANSINSSWKTYTNELDEDPDAEEVANKEIAQDLSVSAEGLSSSRGNLRFNTTFEVNPAVDAQSEDSGLPATWADCDTADLAIVASHLAAAALPPKQQSADDRHADVPFLQMSLEAEDMLGFGTLDMRSCTLIRQAAAFVATQRFGLHSSFTTSVPVRHISLDATEALGC